MGKIKEVAYIEQSIVYHEEQNKPSVYYNVFADGDTLCGVSLERLIVIRNLINKIIKEQEGGQQ